MGASGEEGHGVQELEQHDAESDESVMAGDEEKMTVLSTTRGSAARLREVMSLPTMCIIAVAAFLTGSAITVVCIGCSRSRNCGAGGFTRRTSEYQSLRVASQSCNEMDLVGMGYARGNSRGLSVSSQREVSSREAHRTTSWQDPVPRSTSRLSSQQQDPVPRSTSRLSSQQQDTIPRSSSRPGNSPQEAGGAWTRIEVQDPI